MTWSGGVFTRTNGTNSGSGVWAADKAAAVKIRADRHDTHDQDLAEGINSCLNKDGSNAATGNLNLGGFIYTNAADGTADTHLATKGQAEKKIGRSVTHDFASDADYTLTSTQEGYSRIVFTDTGVVLTTGRNVITSTAHSVRWYQNDTAQTLTIKTSAGTGIAVSAGTSRPLVCDGTNVIDPMSAYLSPIGQITAGTSTAYTVSLGIGSYNTGALYSINFDQPCGDSPTLNIDSIGAKSIVYENGYPVTKNSILARNHSLKYDGTNLVLLDPAHIEVDLSSATSSYVLKVGEIARYTKSAITSFDPKLTLQEGEYELTITTTTALAVPSASPAYMSINGTLYTGAVRKDFVRNTGTTVSGSGSNDDYVGLCPAAQLYRASIRFSTYTASKSFDVVSHGFNGTNYVIQTALHWWNDQTTAFTSFTMTFPASINFTASVRRIA